MAKYSFYVRVEGELQPSEDSEQLRTHIVEALTALNFDAFVGEGVLMREEKSERDAISRRTPRLAILGSDAPNGMD